MSVGSLQNSGNWAIFSMLALQVVDSYQTSFVFIMEDSEQHESISAKSWAPLRLAGMLSTSLGSDSEKIVVGAMNLIERTKSS